MAANAGIAQRPEQPVNSHRQVAGENPAPRSNSSRSNVALGKRIDAVVAAVHIAEHFVSDARLRERPGHGAAPWAIVAELRDPTIDRALIRKWLDEILTARHARPHVTAYIRRDVAEIENALGMPHDARTSALPSFSSNEWDEYVRQVAAEDVGADG
jgi:hypothetical protein